MKKDTKKESLFTGDEVWEKQEEEASLVEKQHKAMTFLGYKLLDSCQNCKYRENMFCTLLQESYSGPAFAVASLGKCKHYKKDSSK